jgi:hypothetical protein
VRPGISTVWRRETNAYGLTRRLSAAVAIKQGCEFRYVLDFLVSRRLRGKVEVNNPTPTEKAAHGQSLRRLQARRCLLHVCTVRIMKGSGSVRIIGVWRCCTYEHLPFYSLLNLSHTRSTCCTCDVCTYKSQRCQRFLVCAITLPEFFNAKVSSVYVHKNEAKERRKGGISNDRARDSQQKE